jgi:hypothetical protein
MAKTDQNRLVAWRLKILHEAEQAIWARGLENRLAPVS